MEGKMLMVTRNVWGNSRAAFLGGNRLNGAWFVCFKAVSVMCRFNWSKVVEKVRENYEFLDKSVFFHEKSDETLSEYFCCCAIIRIIISSLINALLHAFQLLLLLLSLPLLLLSL